MADNKLIKTDILIAGTGCSGLYMAMNLPSDKNILMITKSDCESSDSYLAQGGMCMLKSEDDYDSYFEDTLKAGHFFFAEKSVSAVLTPLFLAGVDFAKTIPLRALGSPPITA